MSTFKTNYLLDTSGRKISSTCQVVQVQKTDTFYSSSTSWVDVPGLSLNIQPYNNNSAILLFLTASWGCNGHVFIRLLRNEGSGQGALVGSGDPVGTNRIHSFDAMYATTTHNTVYYRRYSGGHWLDRPNSTAVLTYKIQIANPYSSSYYSGINYNPYNDADDTWNVRTVSSITAIEIMQ